jgi:pimeloyl-ACP methyl ester carboxylesterase
MEVSRCYHGPKLRFKTGFWISALKVMIKRFIISIILVLVFFLAGSGLVKADTAASVKEVNFVFLHGMNGNAGAMQRIEDSIIDLLPAYITDYKYSHPNLKIQTSTLNRSYPNDVNIETWAKNMADAINKRFAGKKNLVLIGHSMGGKTALYAVSHNIGNLADKVAMVVTINSPIKSLVNYYYVGGDTALDYWGAKMLISGTGVLESLVNYDSSEDGKWVATHKHWLAFVSCESSPLSRQFDTNGVDPLPRNMDDTIVPIDCQYADGAEVVYYGEYAHGDFTELNEVSTFMADQIISSIFGGTLECSVFARGGSFEHKADLFPGTDYWQDLVGGVLASSGSLSHRNDSPFALKEWNDTVGENSNGNERSSYQIIEKNSFPLFTGVKEVSWANQDDPADTHLNLVTRAAPLSAVNVDWSVYQKGLLPSGIGRDHYEVEIETGTQLSSIGNLSWQTSDSRDLRLRISSQSESPFRWFRANWRVFYKENRQRQFIDEMSAGTAN